MRRQESSRQRSAYARQMAAVRQGPLLARAALSAELKAVMPQRLLLLRIGAPFRKRISRRSLRA